MKIRILLNLGLFFCATSAFAAAGGEGEGASLIIKIFFGFFALIVATQLIPGLILLGSLLKSLFGKSAREAEMSEETRGRRSQ
ncbi:hypothetical protein [Geoalkalibacter halelectricus]|uniref:Uncharacterized protein n=1 Tax=Geoalkalibacter halelectricus TaxID=2847045 RepID=A0ABY5ZJJ4_9BACT|nr:hypothetical protein [Geoalkalibacter halelectricus]MDO3377778.1 hypothetical protein [Geoalkalibacter halelectricus]UWZ78629.1 hypothetical protein L9S41_13185 [Geoalkalibacter halelectricus]